MMTHRSAARRLIASRAACRSSAGHVLEQVRLTSATDASSRPRIASELVITSPIENTLLDAGIILEQVHRGDGIASWAVNRRAISRGHGIRTGLEDTPALPDGRQARGNGDLVAAAAALPSEGTG